MRAGSSSTARTRPARDVTELRRGHRLRHPAGRPLPAPDDRRERGHRPAAARLAGGAAARARRGAARPRGARPGHVRRRATRSSSPAASASASAWPGRWPRTRRSCSWTSRSGRSTRSSASASRTSSCASRRRSRRRSCSSPTTSTRPSRWATSWPSSRTAARWPSSARRRRSWPGPASPFVARFVGADRGLKRLSLQPCRRPRAAAARHGPRRRPGDRGASTRARRGSFPWLLLVDEADRPLAWVARDDVRAGRSAGRRAGRRRRSRSSTAGRRSRTP